MTVRLDQIPTGEKLGNAIDETVSMVSGATTAATPSYTMQRSSSATNTAPTVLRLQHITSGTPATGIGAGIDFEVETSASNNEIGAVIQAVTSDATAASEDFDLVFSTMAGGAAAAERFRVLSTGQIKLGTDGSLSAPAIASNGDADTGFIFNAGGTGRVQVVTNGSLPATFTASGAIFDAPFSGRRLINAVTSTGTLPNYQSREVVTNRGASGTVTLTMSSPTSGETYTFLRVAAQALRIEPHAGAAFFRAAATVEAANKYLELGSNGAKLTIMWDGTNWLCLDERGTITVEP